MGRKKRQERESSSLTGRLWNASMPQEPSPTQGDTSPTSGDLQRGSAALKYEDLHADTMDTALETSDLSVEEAIERFHNVLPEHEAGEKSETGSRVGPAHTAFPLL